MQFLNNFFNNGDGNQHVPNPHPVNYYIWGAGGASYFGASNPLGLAEDIGVPDGGFEGDAVGGGQAVQAPAGSPWGFGGTGGVYRHSPGGAANSQIEIGRASW